jgi:Tol biopolymer transport system component
MPLAPGTRLGPYEITAPLGAGGMGEVFRATDTRLGRDVAVKVLPQHLSANPEVRARFEREAKTVSSLNHPHICTLHDVGREGDTDYLVMEMIEGETLAERLVKGALPPAEVLELGEQIADALDRAHRAGVIHRDLKPGNVMLTKSGAKLMDFGLARATGMAGPAAGSGAAMATATHSPMMAAPLTAEGTIVGTFQYMAPEQLEGSEADARSDLWALGCVLYEMATGRRAFEGKSQASLITSIMGSQPAPISQVAPMSPPGLERLVQACLAKDPADRLQSAHDIRMQLAWLAEGGSQAGVPAPVATRRRSRERLAWTLAAVGLIAAGALAGLVAAPSFLLPRAPTVEEPGQVVRFQVTAPPGATMFRGIGHVISPDGTALLWPGTDSEGRPRTWVRRLDSLESRPLPPAVSGSPFWAPDGASIGFVNDGKLRTMPIDGGDPRTVCEAISYRGASWGAEYIVFAGGQGPIFKVPVTGGTPEAVTALDESKGETAHRFPHFLPDGETFLYVALPGKHRVLEVYAGHVDGREPVAVTSSLTSPVYTSGYLVFQRGRRLVAQAFDPDALALSGEPIDLGPAPELWEAAGATKVSASRNGTLAYLTPEDPNTRLVWYDPKTGRDLEALDLEPGAYTEVEFSPDGRHVALVREASPEESDIWVLELDRGILTRFTQGPGNHASVRWSPDSSWIAYSTDADGPWNIYRKPFPGPGAAEPVVAGPVPFKNLLDWSPDGEFLLYSPIGAGTNMDLWFAPADGSGEPRPYQAETYQEDNGRFSPDGRWVAYVSSESGMGNVYIDSFPVPGRKHRVSIDGGFGPSWTPDGTAIRFVTPERMMVEASVQTQPSLRTGIPEELFAIDADIRGGTRAPDGRILVIKRASEARDAGVTVILNRVRQLDGKNP